jgi:hypothetical protein
VVSKTVEDFSYTNTAESLTSLKDLEAFLLTIVSMVDDDDNTNTPTHRNRNNFSEHLCAEKDTEGFFHEKDTASCQTSAEDLCVDKKVYVVSTTWRLEARLLTAVNSNHPENCVDEDLKDFFLEKDIAESRN